MSHQVRLPIRHSLFRTTILRLRVGRVLLAWIVVLVSCQLLVPALTAQSVSTSTPDTGWSSQTNADLTYSVQDNEEIDPAEFANRFGLFAESALAELLLFFDLPPLSTPIEIKAYTSPDDFETVTASLERVELDDVIARADPENLTIHLPLAEFLGMTSFDAENQIRHATSHILTGLATDFQIPRGFDEGIARYVERPAIPVLAARTALVQARYLDGELASWSNLNRTVPIESNDLIDAQSYAVVSYLMNPTGLTKFREFLTALQTSDGWREAMSIAYAPATPDSLEEQWKANIPRWASEEWDWNLAAGFDLEPARALLNRGSYEATTSQLEASEVLARDIDDPGFAEDVADLKDQARIGSLAESKMQETEQALNTFAYDRAMNAVEQAADQYALLPPELRPDDLLTEYTRLAQVGIDATDKLEFARIRSGDWGQYPEARADALAAGTGFAELSDTENRTSSAQLIDTMDHQQLRLVLLLAALALLTAAWLGLWLIYREPSRIKWD